jgi:hypothetical protein
MADSITQVGRWDVRGVSECPKFDLKIIFPVERATFFTRTRPDKDPFQPLSPVFSVNDMIL